MGVTGVGAWPAMGGHRGAPRRGVGRRGVRVLVWPPRTTCIAFTGPVMHASQRPPAAILAAPAGDVVRGAVFDRSRRYRYLLTRRWEAQAAPVLFVLLNPSTADGRQDDPTIRRCMGFARAWGHGALEVANLFAWRATHPADLRRAVAPVGPRNDHYLLSAARRAARVVLAWGIHGSLLGRDQEVLALLERAGRELMCLGLTHGGQPRHVLYLRADTQPAAFPSPR